MKLSFRAVSKAWFRLAGSIVKATALLQRESYTLKSSIGTLLISLKWSRSGSSSSCRNSAHESALNTPAPTIWEPGRISICFWISVDSPHYDSAARLRMIVACQKNWRINIPCKISRNFRFAKLVFAPVVSITRKISIWNTKIPKKSQHMKQNNWHRK